MAEVELKFVDQFADALDPALRAYGQGADRVTSVKDFVDQALGQLGPNNCIRKLTLIGHGSPGSIGVGSGKSAPRSGDKSLTPENLEQWGPQLSRLRCRFCPDGEFDLIGCNTGAGLRGARLLRLIVNLIRCCRARAPVEPVTAITQREIDQIVEAIGEGETARLPEPIEAVRLKTVSMRPQLGPKSLLGGADPATLALYDPTAVVAARFASGMKGGAAAKQELDPSLVRAISRSVQRAQVALAPIALYAVEGYLQLRVQLSPKRSIWLQPGALVGGCAFYSPFGDDTTFLYGLLPGAQRSLDRIANPRAAAGGGGRRGATAAGGRALSLVRHSSSMAVLPPPGVAA